MDIDEYAEIKTQEWLEPVEAPECEGCNYDCVNCPDLPESLKEQAE
jgi:hypothetical protein